MNQTEIIEMAREAGFDPHDMSSDFTCNLENINAFAKLVAEKATKEALAQPEQYPQIAINPEIVGYVAPQRKPLTDEQRFDLLTKFEPYKNKWGAPAILIDMVEAAHGIKDKNTQKTTGENNLSSD